MHAVYIIIGTQNEIQTTELYKQSNITCQGTMYKGNVLYEAGGFVKEGKKFILSKTFIILTLHKKKFL